MSADRPGPRFRATDLDRLERIPLGDMQWRPPRRALGITGFAVNAYTGEKAGDQVIELHDETSAGAGGHEELYAGNPEVIEWAADDADLDSIRDHARFHQAARTAASSRR